MLSTSASLRVASRRALGPKGHLCTVGCPTVFQTSTFYMLRELPAHHHDQPPATDNCPIKLTGASLTVQKTEVICHLPCVQKEVITSAHLRKIISSFIYATENKMLKKSNWQDSPRVGLGYTPEIPYEAPKNNDTSDCTLVRFFFQLDPSHVQLGRGSFN